MRRARRTWAQVSRCWGVLGVALALTILLPLARATHRHDDGTQASVSAAATYGEADHPPGRGSPGERRDEHSGHECPVCVLLGAGTPGDIPPARPAWELVDGVVARVSLDGARSRAGGAVWRPESPRAPPAA